MKGFVIAGGEGTRMRPLSLRRPKHLVPVANRPFVEYQIDCLARAGVTDVILCTNCIPERAERVIETAKAAGVQMTYSVEETPLDTAGAVRQASTGAEDEPFFALNGDALFDFDLKAAYREHIHSSALATICALYLDDTGPCGVLEVEADGRVSAFREPSAAEKRRGRAEARVAGGRVNTGVYVIHPAALDRVPPAQPYSLERGLFPELADEGALAAWEVKGYWLDVGRPEDVAEGSWAVLERRLDCRVVGESLRPGVWVGAGADVASGAELRPPAHIGENANVADGARVGPRACVGAGSLLERQAELKDSVLFEDCTVGEGAVVECVVADRGTRFEPGVRVAGPQVFAEGSVVRARSGS